MTMQMTYPTRPQLRRDSRRDSVQYRTLAVTAAGTKPVCHGTEPGGSGTNKSGHHLHTGNMDEIRLHLAIFGFHPCFPTTCFFLFSSVCCATTQPQHDGYLMTTQNRFIIVLGCHTQIHVIQNIASCEFHEMTYYIYIIFIKLRYTKYGTGF